MESNNIQLFNYESKQVRTFYFDGQIWFVAKDLAGLTGHKSIKDSLQYLDEDEKGAEVVPTNGGNQRVTIINESGFFKLMFRSQLPQAKAFTKYVTAIILPTIRKTGSFNSNTRQLQEIATDKHELQVLTDRKNQINKRLRFLKMRIEENETAIYAAFRPNNPVLQPENESFQYSLF